MSQPQSHPRPLASLSSSLLARKGAARPAMRPQPFAPTLSGPGTTVQVATDDLGWNDMGAPTPLDELAAPQDHDTPAVLVEREALAEAIAAPDVVRPVSVATAARLRRETGHAGKAAFTLRLDADRHLRLRLAGAISNRSAQALITHALDALLLSMPTVDALVAQLPPAKTKR